MAIDENETSCSLDEPERRFFAWAFESLGWQWREDDTAVKLTAAERDRDEFPAESLEFVFVAGDGSPGSRRLSVPSTTVAWLHKSLARTRLFHAAPAGQPSSVHEISERLFAAYDCAGGSVRLSGCQVEQRPLIRVTHWDKTDRSEQRILHYFVAPSGEAIDAELVQALGLSQLVVAERIPKVPAEQLDSWLESAKQAAEDSSGGQHDQQWTRIVTLTWCTYVSGKVAFEFEGAADCVEFAGWARRIVAGQQQPPPFCCRHTGQTSYEVALTDDGRVTVKQAVARCEESGKRVLTQELGECTFSKQQVLAELLAECPVSGKRILPKEMADCLVCHQAVHPESLRQGRCQACTRLRRVSKDDPRMARVLGDHPKLDRWRRWKIAETTRVYVLTASAIYRRLLVVVDKETLETLRVAVGNRFSKRWVDAPVADQDEYG